MPSSRIKLNVPKIFKLLILLVLFYYYCYRHFAYLRFELVISSSSPIID